ncbi:NAD-dependent epimerase [Methylophilales bacterium]|nr:NAD-dependent epimerase [Methylophilales bacterium]
MKILVTGSAGFIGSALSLKLLDKGNTVIGIDNHNNYYDPKLKDARLARHIDHKNYTHFRMNLEDREAITKLFKDHQFEGVVNLAAQAGVRYSIENPSAYIDSNLVGFANLLEGCRHNKVEHLLYASSSSTYGLNTKQPFSTHEAVNHPVSLYAATKKANELMAHAYSHLYNLPTTGLRFFTVYGPYDRPDMALQKFTRAIMNNEVISIFNYGKHRRDFTYIDDVIEAIIRILDSPAQPNPDWNSNKPDPSTSSAPYRVYNIGNNNPVGLMEFIETLETSLGEKTEKKLLPLQPGDVPDTYADIDDLAEDFGYKPTTNIQKGLENFAKWYMEYNNV